MALISPVNVANPEAILSRMQEMGAPNISLQRAAATEGFTPSPGAERVGVAGANGIAPTFATFLKDAVGQVSDKMAVSEIEKQKVMAGESGNIHQAMIAMQESSVAFTLMIEVRNKLVESYQELIRMQV